MKTNFRNGECVHYLGIYIQFILVQIQSEPFFFLLFLHSDSTLVAFYLVEYAQRGCCVHI